MRTVIVALAVVLATVVATAANANYVHEDYYTGSTDCSSTNVTKSYGKADGKTCVTSTNPYTNSKTYVTLECTIGASTFSGKVYSDSSCTTQTSTFTEDLDKCTATETVNSKKRFCKENSAGAVFYGAAVAVLAVISMML